MDYKKINSIFSLFMIFAILIWLYFLIFTDVFNNMLPPLQKYIFTAVLALYSIYRGIRMYIQLKK
ncbi:MAG: hypothetical protein BGO87_02330 [Flavobacteriia bacterium 40-80]|nr:MAG: hypothetical protein BGO87_02330 [Flavobacteriia bacterium 40-80]